MFCVLEEILQKEMFNVALIITKTLRNMCYGPTTLYAKIELPIEKAFLYKSDVFNINVKTNLFFILICNSNSIKD